jgi:hypothetical protein
VDSVLAVVGIVVVAADMLSPDTTRTIDLTIPDLVYFFGQTIWLALEVLGVVQLPWSRAAAYRNLRLSVLASIFLVQMFIFAESQLAAMSGLLSDLLLLSALNTMVNAEARRARSLRAVAHSEV